MAKALAAQGHGVVALVQFLQMLREGFWPDEVIFLGMINAWGHSMLVSKGRQFIQVYGRRVQHHTMDGFFFLEQPAGALPFHIEAGKNKLYKSGMFRLWW
jgi:hypothetical protein